MSSSLFRFFFFSHPPHHGLQGLDTEVRGVGSELNQGSNNRFGERFREITLPRRIAVTTGCVCAFSHSSVWLLV